MQSFAVIKDNSKQMVKHSLQITFISFTAGKVFYSNRIGTIIIPLWYPVPVIVNKTRIKLNPTKFWITLGVQTILEFDLSDGISRCQSREMI